MLFQSLSELRSIIHRAVHGRIDRRFRARFDTSDVVQEATLQAWLRGDADEDSSPSGFWLRFVARRHSSKLHAFHSAQRRSVHAEECPVYDSRHPGNDAPDQAMTREQTEQLLLALARLPKPLRLIVHLRFVERLSFNAIARTMERPPHWVRRQYRQALKQLHSLMQRNEADGALDQTAKKKGDAYRIQSE